MSSGNHPSVWNHYNSRYLGMRSQMICPFPNENLTGFYQFFLGGNQLGDAWDACSASWLWKQLYLSALWEAFQNNNFFYLPREDFFWALKMEEACVFLGELERKKANQSFFTIEHSMALKKSDWLSDVIRPLLKNSMFLDVLSSYKFLNMRGRWTIYIEVAGSQRKKLKGLHWLPWASVSSALYLGILTEPPQLT